MLAQPVTILGSPESPESVEVVWETEEPYQPTVFIAADGVVVS